MFGFFLCFEGKGGPKHKEFTGSPLGGGGVSEGGFPANLCLCLFSGPEKFQRFEPGGSPNKPPKRKPIYQFYQIGSSPKPSKAINKASDQGPTKENTNSKLQLQLHKKIVAE